MERLRKFREKKEVNLNMDFLQRVPKQDLLEQQSRIADAQENVFYIQGNFSDFYIEKDILGEGCVGLVRRVERVRDGAIFASKMVKTREEEEVVTNVIREFKHQRRLHHANIVQVYELYVDETKGRIYSIMELVDAKEMFDVIATLGQYSERIAAHIFKHILLAIDYLHTRGVCHRDLKPNNILCTSDGSLVKITDFNVSKFTYTDNEHKKAVATTTTTTRTTPATPPTTTNTIQQQQIQSTQSSTCCSPNIATPEQQKHVLMWTYTGTVAFSAPEIFAGDSYDESVDMWSAGVVLYTMLAGYQPFEEVYVQDLIAKISAADYKFPDDPFGHISDNAKDLISKCLRVDPRQRITPKQALAHPWLTHTQNHEQLCAAKKISLNLNKFVSKFSALRNLGLIRKPTQRKQTYCTSILYKQQTSPSFTPPPPPQSLTQSTPVSILNPIMNEMSQQHNTHLQQLQLPKNPLQQQPQQQQQHVFDRLTSSTNRIKQRISSSQNTQNYQEDQLNKQQNHLVQSVENKQQIQQQEQAQQRQNLALLSKQRSSRNGCAMTSILHNRYMLNESDQLLMQTLEDDQNTNNNIQNILNTQNESNPNNSSILSVDLLSDSDQMLCQRIFSKMQFDRNVQQQQYSQNQLQLLTKQSSRILDTSGNQTDASFGEQSLVLTRESSPEKCRNLNTAMTSSIAVSASDSTSTAAVMNNMSTTNNILHPSHFKTILDSPEQSQKLQLLEQPEQNRSSNIDLIRRHLYSLSPVREHTMKSTTTTTTSAYSESN